MTYKDGPHAGKVKPSWTLAYFKYNTQNMSEYGEKYN